ncbi:MAG TPA: hypothetical protein PKE32_05700, partial [Miltoncostaeaceae bacterium]|nr:hypothetical protein [Miltoncostaeaceae bacterium]
MCGRWCAWCGERAVKGELPVTEGGGPVPLCERHGLAALAGWRLRYRLARGKRRLSDNPEAEEQARVRYCERHRLPWLWP